MPRLPPVKKPCPGESATRRVARPRLGFQVQGLLVESCASLRAPRAPGPHAPAFTPACVPVRLRPLPSPAGAAPSDGCCAASQRSEVSRPEVRGQRSEARGQRSVGQRAVVNRQLLRQKRCPGESATRRVARPCLGFQVQGLLVEGCARQLLRQKKRVQTSLRLGGLIARTSCARVPARLTPNRPRPRLKPRATVAKPRWGCPLRRPLRSQSAGQRSVGQRSVGQRSAGQ